MKNILVTGGAGFIGSNFIKYMLEQHPDYMIVNLDLLTYAGNLENLKDISFNPNYVFIEGDICDNEIVNDIFIKYGIDTIVNFAAESHVDRSIGDPSIFLTTNVLGTQNLLEIARKFWAIYPDNYTCRLYRDSVKFLQVSTDEVYGSLGSSGLFNETMPLKPNSPYSASKASADLIVRAYNETYGLPVNITRCSNNYGPYQYPEKLIPLMISNCLNNKKLPVYGNGLQVRDWLYVLDHCSAIDIVLHKGKNGEVYNIGGNNEKTNLDIVSFILKKTNKDNSLILHVDDRPGHDVRYAIDNTKIKSELNWEPTYKFEEGLNLTIEWYLNNEEWLKSIFEKSKK
jgi:dTDP-glucose 4,6-dehydratase